MREVLLVDIRKSRFEIGDFKLEEAVKRRLALGAFGRQDRQPGSDQILTQGLKEMVGLVG